MTGRNAVLSHPRCARDGEKQPGQQSGSERVGAGEGERRGEGGEGRSVGGLKNAEWEGTPA